MKIVYCLNSICYFGGIERVTISKANALAEMPGNEVWIIVTENYFAPVLPLSEKVRLVDLKVGYYLNQSKNVFMSMLQDIVRRHTHKERLTPVLEKIAPDVVIAVGQCEKYLVPTVRLASNPVFIREVHYYKHYRRDFADTAVKKILARLVEWYDFGWKCKKYDAIISLTETDRQCYWQGNPKVRVMPNPIIARPSRRSSTTQKVVMAAGRLEEQKNFSALLRIWQRVELRHPDWSLQIWGEGEQRSLLEELIDSLGLKYVRLMGYSPDVIEHYPDASLFAVTSHYEGFALMIVEAMAAGLPVVSYDCPCSPRDLIHDGESGYVVAQEDEEAMADRICKLIEDEGLRNNMGEKSWEASTSYGLDTVAQQWMNLFEELSKKR